MFLSELPKYPGDTCQRDLGECWNQIYKKKCYIKYFTAKWS